MPKAPTIPVPRITPRQKPVPPPMPSGLGPHIRSRPPGMSNEQIMAAKLIRRRIPKDASPEEQEIASWAMQRMVEVMAGKVGFRKAPSVLKAGIAVREEICGPLNRTVEMKGAITLEALVGAATALTEKNVTPAPLPPTVEAASGS